MKMKKIIVIGCPGSGKSTFSRKLSKKTGLPLIHLDMLFWNSDKTTVDKITFIKRLENALGGEEWIIDGNYSSTIGNNRGNDIATKLQRAGDQVVKAVLNDIQACCIKFSGVQEDGMIECYVGIKVPKQAIAAQVAKTVADVLTPDEKMQINFEEDQYRKQMEQRFNDYKEQNK